jgi:hypothetical protein
MSGGERLATDKRQSSVNGAEKCSLYAAPLLGSGEGEDAEGGLLRATTKMPDGDEIEGSWLDDAKKMRRRTTSPCP